MFTLLNLMQRLRPKLFFNVFVLFLETEIATPSEQYYEKIV